MARHPLSLAPQLPVSSSGLQGQSCQPLWVAVRRVLLSTPGWAPSTPAVLLPHGVQRPGPGPGSCLPGLDEAVKKQQCFYLWCLSSSLAFPGSLPMSTALSGLPPLKIKTCYKHSFLPSSLLPWCFRFKHFTGGSEWLIGLIFLKIFGLQRKSELIILNYRRLFLTEAFSKHLILFYS